MGRRTYCSDECYGEYVAARERVRQKRRMQACNRCGGEKELGTQGGRYCAECRRVIADQHQAFEYERGRRRALKEMHARLDAGERVARRTLDVPDTDKWCPRCQSILPKSSFPVHKKGIGGYCIPCQRAYNSERRMRINFGMSWDDYALLLNVQDGRCAICNGRPRKNMLAIDHDHKTGEIRGLLCSRCNHRLLGSANDSPARLRRAADYLEQFLPRDVFGQRRFVPGFGHEEREPLEDDGGRP
jgi:hypothetical protein